MTPDVQRQLQALLESDEGLYQLTILKHEPKDFSRKELRQEGERRRFFQPIYDFAQTFLSSSGVSNDSIRYYASLVQFYTIYKLKRMVSPTARLYLLCFAYHRLREINDNLIEAFIHLVDGYEREAKLSAKESVYQAKTAASANLKAAGQVLNLFVDPSIPTHTPFGSVQEKAFTLLPREQFPWSHITCPTRNLTKPHSNGLTTSACLTLSRSTSGICSQSWTLLAGLRTRRY